MKVPGKLEGGVESRVELSQVYLIGGPSWGGLGLLVRF
jgi:hypothetical protein